MEITERIEAIIKHQRLTSSQFADQIGVQRSSISHILSGRNKPSLDLVQKVLSRYSFINTDWLLFGTGQMVKEMKQKSLFDDSVLGVENEVVSRSAGLDESNKEESDLLSPIEGNQDENVNEGRDVVDNQEDRGGVKHLVSAINYNEVEYIVIFYKNGSFKQYRQST